MTGSTRQGLTPLMIYGEDGHTIWLGAEDTARNAINENLCLDIGSFEIVDIGWMMDVGWDRLNYERKRDFVGETGYTGWWEGVRAPVDAIETKKLRRAWRVSYLAREDH